MARSISIDSSIPVLLSAYWISIAQSVRFLSSRYLPSTRLYILYRTMSIALSVKTNSNVYVAGSIVRGTITVHVDKVSPHVLYYYERILSFNGSGS